MSKSYEEIENERAKRIQKYTNDKDLSIRVSWAINNATQIVSSGIKTGDPNQADIKNAVGRWADWYMGLYERMRQREAENLSAKDDQEKAL